MNEPASNYQPLPVALESFLERRDVTRDVTGWLQEVEGLCAKRGRLFVRNVTFLLLITPSDAIAPFQVLLCRLIVMKFYKFKQGIVKGVL